ncbi:acyl-CoA thioesterase [Chloroflexota bacterium]
MSESKAIMVVPMTPQDANVAGNVHGGVIMKLIDQVGGIVAVRHTRNNVVTASVDKIDFIHPVFIGDVLTLKASLNLVGRTSMEVGVRVEAEDLRTGDIRRTASAFLTYVALDRDGIPMEVAPLILETEEDKRRNRDAQARREARLQRRMKED